MKRYEVEGGRLRLWTDYDERHAAAQIPCARWNAAQECWSYPATPAVWAAAVEAFPDLSNATCEPLAEDLTFRREARANRDADGAWSTDPYFYYTKPWDHQIRATAFTLMMDAVLLHMHMGTGKTKVTLDAMRARGHRQVLVICPLTVITVWEREADKHTPGYWWVLPLRKGSITARAKALTKVRAQVDGPPLLILINYEAAWREPMAAAILSKTWDAIVFDEIHKLKSPGSKVSRFAARIPASHRLGLTGTPMPHSPLDLYGQYRALDPGIFGSRFGAFRSRYAVMGGYENRQVLSFKDTDHMREQMDRLRLHVPPEALDLPEILYLKRECTLDSEGRRFYDSLETDFIAGIEDGTVTVANALVKLLRLQQVAAGFVKMDDGETIDLCPAKPKLLTEMLGDIGKEPVVVFTRFTHDLRLVEKACDDLERPYLEISGRRKDYDDWKRLTGHDKLGPVLGVQIQAGGLGIDLTEARYALFYTMGFSLGDYQQAVARVHRPGQTYPVIIYHLVTTGTVDGKILRALDKRADVIRSVMGDYQGGAVDETG